MAFPPQFLDEIRGRVSLAGAVGHHVKLTRRGREYVGLCPFHSEKTPSFTVVEDKAFYHCFGCGAHGDVIGFTMRMTSMGFREAIENLAREAGLKIPEELPEDRERHARSLSLHDACEQACVFFEEQLRAPGGRAARDYLARRGLDAETIARFRLGWAPDARDALKRALGGRFPEPLLVEAGLLRHSEDRDSYDFFRGRVIFPIADKAGKIIAFGGRTMGDGQPKYLNSPDTPIFDKGRTLYGAHLARTAKTDFLPIVTEGYMDVISLHRAGFPGAVAPLGTALTEMQLRELWRLGDEPVLCFDGDAAGKRAAVRALDRGLPHLTPDVGLKFVLLPGNEDPDSLIKSQGASVFRLYLQSAISTSEFIWKVSTQDRDPSYYSTPEKILGLQSRLNKRIRAIQDGAVQNEFQHYLMDRIWVLRRRVRRARDLEKLTKVSPSVRATAGRDWVETTRRRRQETLLVIIALNHPDIARPSIDALGSLHVKDPELNELWQHVTDQIAINGNLTGLELKTELDFHLSKIADQLSQSAIVRGRGYTDFAAHREFAEECWKATVAKYQLPDIEREREDAIDRWKLQATEENWAPVLLLGEEITRLRTESDHVRDRWEGPGSVTVH